MKMHLNKSTNKKSEQHAAEDAEDGCWGALLLSALLINYGLIDFHVHASLRFFLLSK